MGVIGACIGCLFTLEKDQWKLPFFKPGNFILICLYILIPCRDYKVLLFWWNILYIIVKDWFEWGVLQLPGCWSKCSVNINISMIQARQIHSFVWSIWVSYRRDENLFFQWNVVHITVEVWCEWSGLQLPPCWSKCSLKIERHMMETNPFFLLIIVSVFSAWWEAIVSVECW